MKLKYQKSTGLKVFSIDDIRAWKPCYDPAKHLPEGWRGTLADLARIESIPRQDVLWCAFRPELLSDKLMRRHAVWSYRQTLIFMPDQDPRCIEAANVAERYAEGKATKKELDTAAAAAAAARSAAFSAASDAHDAVCDAYAIVYVSKQVEKLLEAALIEGKERLEKQAKIKARKKK